MMSLDLITRTNAITVLKTFFPKENCQDLVDNHFEILRAEGMEFLLTEDFFDYVIRSQQTLIDPAFFRIFCSGMILGIEAEAQRQFSGAVDQAIQGLDGPCVERADTELQLRKSVGIA